jgi:hypothetical protein
LALLELLARSVLGLAVLALSGLEALAVPLPLAFPLFLAFLHFLLVFAFPFIDPLLFLIQFAQLLGLEVL